MKTPKFIVQCRHHSDTKIGQGCHKQKENYKRISLMNIDSNIFNKTVADFKDLQRSYIITKWVTRIARTLNIHKLISVKHHINKLKDKTKWSSQ